MNCLEQTLHQSQQERWLEEQFAAFMHVTIKVVPDMHLKAHIGTRLSADIVDAHEVSVKKCTQLAYHAGSMACFGGVCIFEEQCHSVLVLLAHGQNEKQC